ncbi:MAG: hypothetical protein ACLQDC_14880, partial [Verrucomicrobiia bacterium]
MQLSQGMTQASESFVEGMVDTFRQPPTGQDEKKSRDPVYRNEFTILVVDDDASFLHLVSSVLRKHGFNVLNAALRPAADAELKPLRGNPQRRHPATLQIQPQSSPYRQPT